MDYRGEWLICLKSRDFTNLREAPYKVGDKIAQVVFMLLPAVKFEEVDNLIDTKRGAGGFGSTGN